MNSLTKQLGLLVFIAFFAILLSTCKDQVDNSTPKQNPIASDFNIGNLNQAVDNITAVTITPKNGKSTGDITIFYNDSTILPTAAGIYTVTFNVASAAGWNTAKGLNAGTLTIINTGITLENSSIKLYLDNNNKPLTEGGNTSIQPESETYTISIAPGHYSEIIWYMNGNVISVGTSNTSIVLTKRIPGVYLVTVEVTTAGEKNTGSHFFVIEEGENNE